MVNVDTVYQRVLALANKEQRGYITPHEFNLFANQAQMETFEQYFYEINQFGRVPGNDTEYSDMIDILEEKVALFKKQRVLTTISSSAQLYNIPKIYFKLILFSSMNFKTGLASPGSTTHASEFFSLISKYEKLSSRHLIISIFILFLQYKNS